MSAFRSINKNVWLQDLIHISDIRKHTTKVPSLFYDSRQSQEESYLQNKNTTIPIYGDAWLVPVIWALIQEQPGHPLIHLTGTLVFLFR